MKKILLASILGIVVTVATASKSQAQGNVFFGNYTGGGATAPVTYSGAPSGGLTAGETIGTGFTADLTYAINGASTYTDSGITASFLAPSGTPTSSGGGLFGGFGNQVTIPGYTSGAANFIVEVYNGANYGSSTIRGQSGVVTLSVLATAANQLPTGGLMSDNGNATAPLTAFTVSPVPEPGIFTLAGLAAAGLMAIRRKKA